MKKCNAVIISRARGVGPATGQMPRAVGLFGDYIAAFIGTLCY